MRLTASLLLPLVILSGSCWALETRQTIQTALNAGKTDIRLPAGTIHLNSPIVIPKGAKGVSIRGSGETTRFVMDAGFRGAAAIVANETSDLTLADFAIEGNRSAMKSEWDGNTQWKAFADFFPDNGVLVRKSSAATIRGVHFSLIRAFAVLFSSVEGSKINSVTVEDSGTLSSQGLNNSTGGVLLEEGCTHFEILNSTFNRIAGNAIWTHSWAWSPRQSDGLIRGNTITTVARDAIQVGHATRIRVEANKGSQLGFPVEYVDFPHYGTAVALDTAGNVDHSVYADNHFTAVAGQCIDLDGFHDGEITGNSCINDPAEAAKWIGLHYAIVFGNHDPASDSGHTTISRNEFRGFAYGGILMVGEGNTVQENHFADINLARCGTKPVSAKCNALPDQPDALRSGIYLTDDGGRKAVTRANTIRNNTFSGFEMSAHCVTSKAGVDLHSSTIAGNTCTDTTP